MSEEKKFKRDIGFTPVDISKNLKSPGIPNQRNSVIENEVIIRKSYHHLYIPETGDKAYDKIIIPCKAKKVSLSIYITSSSMELEENDTVEIILSMLIPSGDIVSKAIICGFRSVYEYTLEAIIPRNAVISASGPKGLYGVALCITCFNEELR
jgi:hypothetical protein